MRSRIQIVRHVASSETTYNVVTTFDVHSHVRESFSMFDAKLCRMAEKCPPLSAAKYRISGTDSDGINKYKILNIK